MSILLVLHISNFDFIPEIVFERELFLFVQSFGKSIACCKATKECFKCFVVCDFIFSCTQSLSSTAMAPSFTTQKKI